MLKEYIEKEQEKYNLGTGERKELVRLLDCYRENPSNGNRHIQAIVDYINSISTYSLVGLLDEIEKEVERMRGELNGDDDGNYYNEAIGDVVSLLNKERGDVTKKV